MALHFFSIIQTMPSLPHLISSLLVETIQDILRSSCALLQCAVSASYPDSRQMRSLSFGQYRPSSRRSAVSAPSRRGSRSLLWMYTNNWFDSFCLDACSFRLMRLSGDKKIIRDEYGFIPETADKTLFRHWRLWGFYGAFFLRMPGSCMDMRCVRCYKKEMFVKGLLELVLDHLEQETFWNSFLSSRVFR